MIYAVIDTNVVVSALITKHRDAATYKVMQYIVDGLVAPLYDDDIIKEYREVLERGKFIVTQSEIDRVIDYFYKYGIKMNRTEFNGIMPDEDDRVFYEVSLSKDDSFLVTRNLKHYPISPRIVSPRDFVSIVES